MVFYFEYYLTAINLLLIFSQVKFVLTTKIAQTLQLISWDLCC